MDRTAATLHKLKMGAGFVVFSAVFGPFLLNDPPLYGGFNRREWLAIAIGLTAWGLAVSVVVDFGGGLTFGPP